MKTYLNFLNFVKWLVRIITVIIITLVLMLMTSCSDSLTCHQYSQGHGAKNRKAVRLYRANYSWSTSTVKNSTHP